MVHWKWPEMNWIHIILETYHFSLNRDCGRKSIRYVIRVFPCFSVFFFLTLDRSWESYTYIPPLKLPPTRNTCLIEGYAINHHFPYEALLSGKYLWWRRGMIPKQCFCYIATHSFFCTGSGSAVSIKIVGIWWGPTTNATSPTGNQAFSGLRKGSMVANTSLTSRYFLAACP